MGPRDRPKRPSRHARRKPTGWRPRTSGSAAGSSPGVLAGVLRDALRTFLIVSAAASVTFPLLPRRPPPPRPVAAAPFGYVATCCARPVYIQELKR